MSSYLDALASLRARGSGPDPESAEAKAGLARFASSSPTSPRVATRSIGVSHLRLDGDGRILLHQDDWDAASGLFEHIPVLGYGIRATKARL